LDPEWPQEMLDAIGVDGRTAIVALPHDTKLDDPALDRALRMRDDACLRDVDVQATGHIPMENDVEAVARALADFFTGY
jgi:hypothetical protein